MALFVGEFEQSVDAKRRLAISTSLRELMVPSEDGRNFFLVLGPDRHLWLYPDLYYRRLVATLRRSPLPSRGAQKTDLLFGMARFIKPDSQGRVVLPEKSMRRAKIAARVTLVGKNDHIEIWPSDEWDQYVEQSLPGYGEMLYEAAERMESLPLDES